MSAMASQITSLTIVYSNVYSRRRSKKTSKLCTSGLCDGNSSVTGEFSAQRARDAGIVSIWLRHHEKVYYGYANKLNLKSSGTGIYISEADNLDFVSEA